jgi:very-short-patch-repair endonuclease
MGQSNSNALRVSPQPGDERSAVSVVRRIASTIRVGFSNPARPEIALALELLCEGLRGLDTHVFRRGCCIGGWPVDLVCVEAALVVQIDASAGARYGERLARALAGSGYRVLRFRSDEVLQRPEDALAEVVLQLPVD